MLQPVDNLLTALESEDITPATPAGEADSSSATAAWRRLFEHAYLPSEVSGIEVPAERYRRLLHRYRAVFPENRQAAVARAPGRVNLLGEHTDYNDGPVLPAAVDRDIAAVFTPRDDGLVRVREAAAGFGDREFTIDWTIAPFSQGDWGNYVKAGIQELVREMGTRGDVPAGRWRGFDALVDGTVPPAGGLSSSSALVVLSGLLFLRANGLEMERKELAGVMAEAEHYVGTRGGGMDQAASLLGEEGKALLIDFAGFSISPVALPEDCSLLVAHSLVPAAKSAAARAGYNLRAAECRIAAELFRRRLEQHFGAPVAERSIGTLRRYLSGLSAGRREELIGETFPPGRSFTPEELEREYGISGERLRREFGLEPELLTGTGSGGGELKLRERFLHVLGECERVEEIAGCFSRGEAEAAGRLMDESHRSCRELFEISCRELDLLTEIQRKAGALGARMTGAGFGGCTVALVPRGSVEGLRRRIIKEYYRRIMGSEREEYGDLLFPVKPAPGAGLIDFA